MIAISNTVQIVNGYSMLYWCGEWHESGSGCQAQGEPFTITVSLHLNGLSGESPEVRQSAATGQNELPHWPVSCKAAQDVLDYGLFRQLVTPDRRNE